MGKQISIFLIYPLLLLAMRVSGIHKAAGFLLPQPGDSLRSYRRKQRRRSREVLEAAELMSLIITCDTRFVKRPGFGGFQPDGGGALNSGKNSISAWTGRRFCQQWTATRTAPSLNDLPIKA